MYFLPFYIKRYKVKLDQNCFIRHIRTNTWYIYNEDGYLRDSNPRGLICRNEKDRTIYLKERPINRKFSGAVTAIMIADDKNETIVTTVAYHDSIGTFYSVLMLVGAILLGIVLNLWLYFFLGIGFVFLMNLFDYKDFVRQREFIEKYIDNCKME